MDGVKALHSTFTKQLSVEYKHPLAVDLPLFYFLYLEHFENSRKMHRLSRNNCKAVHCIKSILHRVTVGNTAPIMVVSSRQMSHAIFRYPRITSMLLRTTKVNQRGLAADAQSASEPPVIANDSWAAEALEKQGEKLASSEDKPLVLVDDELMKGPPPATIKKLCDDILALNVVEVAQLMSIIQVTYHFFWYRLRCATMLV